MPPKHHPSPRQERVKKNYIWMIKSEPMNEFVVEGGTYDKYLCAMLFHTFLVTILGSLNLTASVEEEVRSNDVNLLFRRDHSERYTSRQTGEIMSEGIETDGDISMECTTLLYTSDQRSESLSLNLD